MWLVIKDNIDCTWYTHERNVHYHYTTHIQDIENSNTDLCKILFVIRDKSLVQDMLKQPPMMAPVTFNYNETKLLGNMFS